MKIAHNWEELDGLESEKYRIEVDPDGYSGWIVPKVETEETKGENYLDHHKYLSTHSFYKEKNQYQFTNRLLKQYGFDVEVVGY